MDSTVYNQNLMDIIDDNNTNEQISLQIVLKILTTLRNLTKN